MTNGHGTRKGLHQRLLGEIIAHIAKAAGVVEPLFRAVADNAASFLSAVLQCVQTKGDEVCSVLDANDTENPALLFQFVIIKRVGGWHVLGQGAAPNPDV